MNVFIVGAGFTKAVLPASPLNGELLSVLAAKNDKSACAELHARYKTRDIEFALTKLDVEIAAHEGGLKSLRQRVEREVASHFRNITASLELVERTPWLSELISRGFNAGDVAISLNYDCLLEGALDCQEKWFPKDGYGYSIFQPLISDSEPATPVKVLKIHGSANFVIAPKVGKLRSEGVSFVLDDHFFPRSGASRNFGYGAGTGRPYVIAPSYVKIPSVEISYLMLDALKATTSAKNLIVIGCSLRPEDSFLTVLQTNFLHQPSWSERRLIIVDPNAEAIRDRIISYWGVDVSAQVVAINGGIGQSVAALLEKFV